MMSYWLRKNLVISSVKLGVEVVYSDFLELPPCPHLFSLYGKQDSVSVNCLCILHYQPSEVRRHLLVYGHGESSHKEGLFVASITCLKVID